MAPGAYPNYCGETPRWASEGPVHKSQCRCGLSGYGGQRLAERWTESAELQRLNLSSNEAYIGVYVIKGVLLGRKQLCACPSCSQSMETRQVLGVDLKQGQSAQGGYVSYSMCSLVISRRSGTVQHMKDYDKPIAPSTQQLRGPLLAFPFVVKHLELLIHHVQCWH